MKERIRMPIGQRSVAQFATVLNLQQFVAKIALWSIDERM